MTPIEENPKKKHERKDFAFGISFPEFVTSIGVGVTSGLATAAKTVRDLFKDDAREATAFKTHFEDRANRLDAIDLKQTLAAGKTKADYQHLISEEKKAIAADFRDIAYAKRGVSKNAVMGTIDKFKLLSPDSKYELYFTGAIGAVVGAALTLGFFNGVATRDKIDKIADVTGADKER